MSDGHAPSAIRMPSSRRRRATEYETTPYTPSAASNAAAQPNTIISDN